MIQAILFDLDGTLVDSYPAILESLNYTRGAFGLSDVDLADVKRMVGRGLENLIRTAIGEKDLASGMEVFRTSYDKTHMSGSFLLPGVFETLQTLQQHSIPMAVASNKPADYSKNILRHLGIDAFFVDCVGPEIVGKPKPDPAMLNYLLQRLQKSPGETLYVGDMILDAETARNAGVRLALVSTGGNSYEELMSLHPDYLLRSLSNFWETINA
jgi:phosphoglycolate phosphatase